MALRAALRLVLVEANGVDLRDVDQAVLCCFCDGSPHAATGVECDVPRGECPKVSACDHVRGCTCA